MTKDLLGRLMWAAVSRKLGAHGILKHGIKDMEDELALTEKTILRKLKGETPWLLRELVDFQGAYDDNDVQEYIDSTFKAARLNGRKEIQHGEQPGKVPGVRAVERSELDELEQRILQTVRTMLEDSLRKDKRRRRRA